MAEEKVSKIEINGQNYIVKDAIAREAIRELQETIENLTLIPVDPADVFSLPNGAMFISNIGYCYQIGKLLLINCTIGALNFIAEEGGMSTDTGITIKSEYHRKIENSIAWCAQTLLRKNGAIDVCQAQLSVDIDGGPNGSITMGFPSSVGGATVMYIMFGGVIPLTKE